MPPASHEEVRSLVHLGLLEVDHRPAPVWCVFPSADACAAFDESASAEAFALADPDRRLGIILEAAVDAFNGNPAEPLRFAPQDQVDVVTHPCWRLRLDAVHEHDLRQLEEIGMVSLAARGDEWDFWPTATAKKALADIPAFVEQMADDEPDESQRSRLREWAIKLRVPEFAANTVAGSASGVLVFLLTHR